MSETKKVTPHEILTQRVGTIDEFKDGDKIHPGVQKYLDVLPPEYKMPHDVAVHALEEASDELFRDHESGLRSARHNMGPEVVKYLDKFNGLHTLKTSAELEAALRNEFKGTLAGKVLADPNLAPHIKLGNLLPADQTVTIGDVKRIAGKINSNLESLGGGYDPVALTFNSPREIVLRAVNDPLEKFHLRKLHKASIPEGATASSVASAGATGATPSESGFAATKKLVDAKIDELVGPKSTVEAEQLKKGFEAAFKDQKDMHVPAERIEGKVKAFVDGSFKESMDEAAKKARAEGNHHAEFLNGLKADAGATIAQGAEDVKKIDEVIKTQQAAASKILSRGIIGRLTGFKDHYGFSAVNDDFKKVGEGRATGRLALRGAGTVTGVGLIISGFGDFKGREANDNTNDNTVESRPLLGLIKTVGGAGLVGISALYKGMGGRAVA